MGPHGAHTHTTIIINTDKRHINNMVKLIVSLFMCLNWSIFQLAFTSGSLAGILIYCLSAPKHNLYVPSLFDFVFAISFLSIRLVRSFVPENLDHVICVHFGPFICRKTTWMEFSTFALILPSIFYFNLSISPAALVLRHIFLIFLFFPHARGRCFIHIVCFSCWTVKRERKKNTFLNLVRLCNVE